MIIKGTSRSGPRALAAHLGNAEKNERVTLLETKGVIAKDLLGALVEMDAYALGTMGTKTMYHAAISPAPPHRLSAEQRAEAIDALEAALGLSGNARVVVMHEKLGREHIHIVWSRVDLKKMTLIHDGHNFRKHEEVARDLERRFGHERVQGAHHERDGKQRPARTPSRAELRQEERSGIKGKDIRKEVTEAFRAADNPRAFQAALKTKGYVLALGDRRDFVIVDRAGGIHSLARRIEGVKAAQLRKYMEPFDTAKLPSAQQAKQAAKRRRELEQYDLAKKKRSRADKRYAGGADYVSQSTAAQKDFAERQKKLNRQENDAIRTFDYKKPRTNPSDNASDDAQKKKSKFRNIERDERQKGRDHTDDDDRQPRAPGGGRTRSR